MKKVNWFNIGIVIFVILIAVLVWKIVFNIIGTDFENQIEYKNFKIEIKNIPTEEMWEDEEINRTKRLSQGSNRTPVPAKIEKEQNIDQNIPQASDTSDFQKRIDDAMKKNIKEEKHTETPNLV